MGQRRALMNALVQENPGMDSFNPLVASVFGEPADFAAFVAPFWSKSDSCGYHLSENPATASEKQQESE